MTTRPVCLYPLRRSHLLCGSTNSVPPPERRWQMPRRGVGPRSKRARHLIPSRRRKAEQPRKAERATPMKMDAGQLRDFAERYTAAWCSQDPESVAAFFSTDGSLSINGGAPAVGRAAIRVVVHGFMTAFPDLVLTMGDVRAKGMGPFTTRRSRASIRDQVAPGRGCCSAGSRSGRSV